MPEIAKRALGDTGDEPVEWWAKRVRPSAPRLPLVGDGALLKLLAEKGLRNGELRAQVDRCEEELLGVYEELLEAREGVRAAHEQIEALSQKVEALQGVGTTRESLVSDAAASEEAVSAFVSYGARGVAGARGKGKKGELRAGWPTCKTVELPFSQVAFFRRAGLEDPYDLTLAIVSLKVASDDPVENAKLRTVSTYQSRDVTIVLRLKDAPWKRGCVASFLAYMDSREFEDTGARDRKHWMCMKLWPGRFGTAEEYLHHEACMSKAGKFITSINKLRALYARDVAHREEQKKKETTQ